MENENIINPGQETSNSVVANPGTPGDNSNSNQTTVQSDPVITNPGTPGNNSNSDQTTMQSDQGPSESVDSTSTGTGNSAQTVSDPAAKPLEADLSSSTQSIEDADKALKVAQKDYDVAYTAYEDARKKRNIASEELDKAKNELNAAEKTVNDTRDRMVQLQAKATNSNSVEDKAAYEAASAEYNKAEEDLKVANRNYAVASNNLYESEDNLNAAQKNLAQSVDKLNVAHDNYDKALQASGFTQGDGTQTAGDTSSTGTGGSNTQKPTGDFEPYKAPEVPNLVTDKPSWETPISTKATGYADYLLGEKTYTNIDYDSVLFTCQNIRDNIIPDLMTIMDDFTEMYQKRDTIWHGQAGEKYFIDFRKDLDRYKTYLEQCSLERYIRAVEQLVADNRTTDKAITADDIAKINDEIPFIFPVDFSTAGIEGNSAITNANEANGNVQGQVDTGKDEGQNDTSNVGTNDNIGANINNDKVDGQNDTSNVGTNDNIGANINNDKVEGQNDTSKVGVENSIESSTNSDEVNGQNDTSKIGSSQDIDASESSIESENSNYEESLKAALLSNFNDITGGDE